MLLIIISSPTKSVPSKPKSIVSVGSSVSSEKLKDESIYRIFEVKFDNIEELHNHLTKAGVVKKSGSSLLDLQKSLLASYNVKTLALFYQHLCPDSNVDDAKKGDLILLILKVLSKGNLMSRSHGSSTKNDAKVDMEAGRKGLNLHSKIVTPVKVDIAQELNPIINLSVVK